MSEKTKQGPTDKKCTGCVFHELTRKGKGDSETSDNYCSHQLAPNSLRKLTSLHSGNGAFIGYNDNTPQWCPVPPIPGKKLRGTSIMSTKK